MKKYPSILFFSFLFIQNATSQEGVIYLENPSFEGTPAVGEAGGKLPDGWFDCGFPHETPPDVHLVKGNPFGVETLPYHGDSYLGLVVRENDTYERIGQKLSSPLKAGVEYSFSIYMARSLFYTSPTPTSNGKMFNYVSPCKLRIWGGNERCQRQELIAESNLIINSRWIDFQLTLKPSSQYNYIVLEAFYKTPSLFPYNGNILIDHASNIIPVDSFEIDTSKVTLRGDLKYDEKDYAVPGSNLTRFEFTEPHWGTEFKIVLYAESDSLAARVSLEAFERITKLGGIFSELRDDSEIGQLSSLAGTGKGARVSNDLWNVLLFARQVTDRSKGTYDFTAGAVTKLWQQAFWKKELPAESEIKKALETVGLKYVKLGNRQEVQIQQPGLRLDLGNIARGYAVDEALKLLKKRGVSMALVDGGGDIAAGSPPPGEEGWRVERAFYEEKELKTEFINIANQAISTAGATYEYLEQDGKRYSHIIDPRTGYGVTKRETVSVVAPTCAEAAAWATALGVEVVTDAYLRLKKNGVKVYFSSF